MFLKKTELSIRLVSRKAISSYRGGRGCGTEKRLPVFKIEIAVEEVEGDKKPMFSGKPGSGVLPQLAQVVAYGMKRKCDQVQSHQCVGQPLFAVSEVMFHVIAVFFQQVKPFVFNLPARPTGGHNLGCIGFGGIKRGDEAKALRGLAVNGIHLRNQVHSLKDPYRGDS